ncbi:hypothetical protein Misp01_27420 [Microtetraspora sp. NBRC 13810]|nr:hypothetical protein Misp01_27420 [Microtetraspora sp. NBRC 13810]
MHEHVDVRQPVRQERIPNVDDPPGDVRDVAALLVDGHDAAEIRRRGHVGKERPAQSRGRAGDGDDRWAVTIRGRHQVLTLH